MGIQNTSTTFALIDPLLMPSSLPLVPTPGNDLFLMWTRYVNKKYSLSF
jgi:hypothetical protein